MSRIAAFIGVAILVSAAPFAFSAYAQTGETVVAPASPSTTEVKPPDFDPKSLLGKCEGNWYETGRGIMLYLVFNDATEDGRVKGTIYVSNPRVGFVGTQNREIPFAGRLAGEQLNFTAENLVVSLEIPGGRIQGGTWSGPRQRGGIRDVTCTRP